MKHAKWQVLLKGALLGGVVFFFWTNISWMALGWHNSYVNPVPNEDAMGETIRGMIPENGIYFIPYHDKGTDPDVLKAKVETGPFAWMLIFPQGKSFSMGVPMVLSILVNCMLAALATCLLMQTSGLTFLGKVGFVKMVGLTGSIWLVFANWNWWGYPPLYLLVNIIDLGIAWGLVGLVLAKYVVKN